VAAYTSYLQNFGSGAHVSEASQRIVAVNERARKDADEKAWADAEKTGRPTPRAESGGALQRHDRTNRPVSVGVKQSS